MAITSDRFSGIIRLYGEAAFSRFQEAKVAIIGIGGVGSWAVEAIARSGVGQITLVDLDEICISNVNRQLHAMDGQIGKLKTTAMMERVTAINPECQLLEKQTFYSEKNAIDLLSDAYDLVIDAIDAVPHKTHLIHFCREKSIPIITCGAAGGRRNPTMIQVSDLAHCTHDPLLQQTRKRLRTLYRFPAPPSDRKMKAKKFGVTAIYSTESPVYPQCDGNVSTQKPEKSPLRLNCASGYGTSTCVTASFGMIAAAEALSILSRQ